MLNELRSGAGNFAAKLLLAFLVLSFAIWGIGDMVRHPGGNQWVAKIGSQSISVENFQRAYQREVDNVRRSLGDNFSPEMVKNLNVRQRVLQRLINRNLLKQESDALGLIPGDADIVRRIRSNPQFQDSKGNFDKSIFEANLRNSGLTEQGYVDQMRQELATTLIVESITGAAVAPDFAARTLYDAIEEQRVATLYTLSPSLVANVAHPSREQVAAYYNDHKREFSAPEYRTLSYVTVNADDVRKKATVSEADLQAAYKERAEEFRRPERRETEQLLFSNEDKAKAAYGLLQKGTPFAEVAKSSDILNKKATSLGSVSRDSILESAADAVFSLKEGEVTQPVQSAFGWHIFHVTAIHPPQVPPFAEVRAQLEKDLAQHAADEALTSFTNKLEDTLAGGGTLQEVAKEFHLKLASLGPVTESGIGPDGKPAKNLPALDKFLDTAFKTEEKTESSLIPTRGGVYYVVRVESVTPEHARPLDEVYTAAVLSWQKAEREKKLLEAVKEISPKLSDSATRADTIARYRLQGVVTGALKRSSRTANGIDLPPELVADIFAHPPGKSTGAYPLANGNYIIAVVKDIVPAPAPGSDARLRMRVADVHKNLENTLQGELLQQYLTYLAKKYPVRVNESVLDAATQ